MRAAPLQVGAAQDWLRSRQKDVETSGAVTLEYDWCGTFLLPALAPCHAYCAHLTHYHCSCTTLPSSACFERGLSVVAGTQSSSVWCRTYTTSYKGTLQVDGQTEPSTSGVCTRRVHAALHVPMLPARR